MREWIIRVILGGSSHPGAHMTKPIGAAILTTACLLVATNAQGHPRCSLDTVTTYAAGESPESIAIDRAGNAYVSVGSSIRRRTPDGQETTFSTLPIAAFALGVKVGPDGCVYNTSTSLNPAVAGAFVWRTCTPGTAQLFSTLDPSGGPNDLAFDDNGDLLVTDPFLGRVYKVPSSGGTATVWLQHSLLDGNPSAPFLLFHAVGVDGIAFDEDKHNVYLGNLDFGRIVRVPIRCDGSAGAPSVFASDPRLIGIDGIALDERGNIFAAVNGQDHLVSVSRHGSIKELAAGAPLDGPASLAFGTRHNDRRTLYVISGAFLRTFGLQAGTPHPALLMAHTAHEGLPLP
jgi:sugar lactone lactonase YvrE